MTCSPFLLLLVSCFFIAKFFGSLLLHQRQCSCIFIKITTSFLIVLWVEKKDNKLKIEKNGNVNLCQELPLVHLMFKALNFTNHMVNYKKRHLVAESNFEIKCAHAVPHLPNYGARKGAE